MYSFRKLNEAIGIMLHVVYIKTPTKTITSIGNRASFLLRLKTINTLVTIERIASKTIDVVQRKSSSTFTPNTTEDIKIEKARNIETNATNNFKTRLKECIFSAIQVTASTSAALYKLIIPMVLTPVPYNKAVKPSANKEKKDRQKIGRNIGVLICLLSNKTPTLIK
jgi:hypothetical protein